jgi:hypothetical protein
LWDQDQALKNHAPGTTTAAGIASTAGGIAATSRRMNGPTCGQEVLCQGANRAVVTRPNVRKPASVGKRGFRHDDTLAQRNRDWNTFGA